MGFGQSPLEGVELIPKPIMGTDFWLGKRILLTGHTGFKGSWLGLWLSELGAEVTGIGLEPDTDPNLFDQLGLRDRITAHYNADIRDSKTLAEIVQTCQPEIVFHLAAQPLVQRSYKDPVGTWATNVQGSLHLLEALKALKRKCAVVMVTTDKVYANEEWDYGYRENDRLGGHDPYSASKAAAEIAIASWRSSFCGLEKHQTPYLAIATARAGNVIGGGDWASDRIVPDAIRAISNGKTINVRNPYATRPWQHVLEPLSGYLLLAKHLASKGDHESIYTGAFNFGPKLEGNRTVQNLVTEMIDNWSGAWRDASNPSEAHEARRLHLQIDKAHHRLGWCPRWDFKTTVKRTVNWYKTAHEGDLALKNCLDDIASYQKPTDHTNTANS